ncbi:peptide ABC transporter substrate-binding protein [Candidatus Saccharibacteria bacterium]|nr:peptide ABC transporter substrate-binding protein [Candidatus Saccharibacteria bacterium]
MAQGSKSDKDFEQTDGPAPGHEVGRLKRLERATALHANNFIIRRIENLKEVRRTAIFWVICAAALIIIGAIQVNLSRPLYSHVGQREGGSYVEGMVGEVATLNPILVTSAAERSVSRLLFASLLSVDEEGEYVGQLARSWSLDDTGKVYTVDLKPNLKWSDGVALTSRDVVFTVQTIQNPAVRSPYASAWREVIIEAVDDDTLTIKLPSEYAPFLGSLTVGILPQHLLASVSADRLRNASFNERPLVGSGPFDFRSLSAGRSQNSQQDITLTASDTYLGGKPKVERFIMRLYEDSDQLTNALRDREIMAATDIPHNQLDVFKDDKSLRISNLKPFSAVYAFFKQSAPPLDDAKVRKALLMALDRPNLVSKLQGVELIEGPLLPGQLGYDPNARQAGYDPAKAAALLDEAGWKLSGNVRKKDGQPLHINLVGINSGDYNQVLDSLHAAWSRLGVEVKSNLETREGFQANVISPHSYDVLVYELSLGRDSDTFAYWHSSQAEPGRLNLAEYRSPLADEALNSGRIRGDQALRAIKYKAFANTWLADTPAIALYRPNVAYVSLAKTKSVTDREVGDITERLSNVVYWSAEAGWLDNTR